MTTVYAQQDPRFASLMQLTPLDMSSVTNDSGTNNVVPTNGQLLTGGQSPTGLSDLNGVQLTTTTGPKTTIHLTGRKTKGAGVTTTKVDDFNNIASNYPAHHTFRNPAKETLFPGMSDAEIQAKFGNISEHISHDFTIGGTDLRAHVPFKIVSANNTKHGDALVVEFHYPDGRVERARLLHGTVPAELKASAGSGKLFDGGSVLYKEGNIGPTSTGKHTDFHGRTSVVADLLKANGTGQYLSMGTNTNTVASGDNGRNLNTQA